MAQGVPTTTAYQYAGDTVDPKTPSCGSCKEKNYTRTYCRVNKKHRTLPWSTVYVVLTLRPDGAIPPPEEEQPSADIIREMNAKRRKVGKRGAADSVPVGKVKTDVDANVNTAKSEDGSTKK